MNRKIKKRVTTVLVVFFFAAGGLWYLVATGTIPEKQQEKTEIAGVFDTIGTKQVSVTPVTSAKVQEEVPEQAEELVVYVCGAVNEPGIYTLPKESRLYEAVALAGGFSAEADPAYHNLAREIADGERIYILTYEETKILTTVQQVEGESDDNKSSEQKFLINLNTATAEQLTALPGIGDAKAASILEYRKKAGRFTDIEEIMNVSGIGEAMFEKIKDKITVK